MHLLKRTLEIAEEERETAVEKGNDAGDRMRSPASFFSCHPWNAHRNKACPFNRSIRLIAPLDAGIGDQERQVTCIAGQT